MRACAVLTLGPEADSLLASVNFSLYYTDPGQRQPADAGYGQRHRSATGRTACSTDNFRGVWGSIDGAVVYMELSQRG